MNNDEDLGKDDFQRSVQENFLSIHQRLDEINEGMNSFYSQYLAQQSNPQGQPVQQAQTVQQNTINDPWSTPTRDPYIRAEEKVPSEVNTSSQVFPLQEVFKSSTPVAPFDIQPKQVKERKEKVTTDNNNFGKLFAGLGGLITLIGIILLVVFSARNGYFGPVPRTMVLALFSGGLVYAGHRLHEKSIQAASIVSAGIGFSGVYLTLIALTSIYDWIPATAGIAFAVLTALGANLLSQRWGSQALSIVNISATVIAAPIITGGFNYPTAIFFVISFLASSHLLHSSKQWVAQHVVSASVLLFTSSILAIGYSPYSPVQNLVVVLLASIVVWGVTTVYPRYGYTHYSLGILAGIAALPVITILHNYFGFDSYNIQAVDPTIFVIFVSITLSMLLGVCAFSVRQYAPKFAYVLYTVAATFIFVMTVEVFGQGNDVAVILGEAFILGIVSNVLRSKITYFISLGFGSLGLIGLLENVGVFSLFDKYSVSVDTSTVNVVSAAISVVWLFSSLRTLMIIIPSRQNSTSTWVAYMSAVSYAMTTFFVLGTTLILDGHNAIIPSNATVMGSPDNVPSLDGFLVGHLLATLSITVLGFVLLARFLAGQNFALRTAGLVVTSVALVMLAIDLSVLEGIVRILAFIGVGVAFIVLSARYGKPLSVKKPVGMPTSVDNAPADDLT